MGVEEGGGEGGPIHENKRKIPRIAESPEGRGRGSVPGTGARERNFSAPRVYVTRARLHSVHSRDISQGRAMYRYIQTLARDPRRYPRSVRNTVKYLHPDQSRRSSAPEVGWRRINSMTYREISRKIEDEESLRLVGRNAAHFGHEDSGRCNECDERIMLDLNVARKVFDIPVEPTFDHSARFRASTLVCIPVSSL